MSSLLKGVGEDGMFMKSVEPRLIGLHSVGPKFPKTKSKGCKSAYFLNFMNEFTDLNLMYASLFNEISTGKSEPVENRGRPTPRIH